MEESTAQPRVTDRTTFEELLVGREVGFFHLVSSFRDGDRVDETYWTSRRGIEAADNSYVLMDLTPYGRQEPWEDSPSGWPLGFDDLTAPTPSP
ncbi:DUF899 family protein [Mumia zhuanghuii]|uniref:DUF899 domain-containing protein n=1 Tax=Mumia zhuanghuii TaxID=2585211 RepID=A0A5C4M7A1_9ACTN|nr:DUF899 family protein [Mumia zhuanghuii]TNC28386.1 DUF899 domain-containing protein [Mumia zhuanghuii]TNC36492.1 DUF899 domain-containing protein [Mumia zhuanghuii]